MWQLTNHSRSTTSHVKEMATTSEKPRTPAGKNNTIQSTAWAVD